MHTQKVPTPPRPPRSAYLPCPGFALSLSSSPGASDFPLPPHDAMWKLHLAGVFPPDVLESIIEKMLCHMLWDHKSCQEPPPKRHLAVYSFGSFIQAHIYYAHDADATRSGHAVPYPAKCGRGRFSQDLLQALKTCGGACSFVFGVLISSNNSVTPLLSRS